jgi:prepilin-type processing-associated H-X9-DG protein
MKALFVSIIIAVLVPVALAAPAQTPPLADKIPADALLYVGWSGGSNLGAAYAQSHLKAVLDASGAGKLLSVTLPQLVQRASGQNAEARDLATSLGGIARRMASHPCAIYFGGADFTNPNKPQPRLALLCDAGPDAAVMARDLQSAIDKLGDQGAPVRAVATPDNLLVLSVGPARVPVAANTATLGGSATFNDVMAQVHPSAVLTAYVNTAGIVKFLDTAPVKGKRAQKDHENWVKVRDALHLADAKALAWTSTFDGKDWATRAFLAAPQPRAGVWAALDAKPVADEMLKLIPQTATLVSAGTFDGAKLLGAVRSTAGQIDPNSPANIDRGLDRFRTMTGLDLQADVLEPLGEQWAIYNDPTVGGSYTFSLVLLNKLDDAAKAEASLAQLARSLAITISGAAGPRSGMRFSVQELAAHGATIHYVALPIVRPSWAIKNGVLYVGLFPQVVSSALARTPGGDAKSILDNENFAAVRKRLGGAGEKATSIRYLDLPRAVPPMYATWLFVSGYAGFADMYGVPTPPMLLPPLDQLAPHLAPAGSVSWVDDAGWHASGVTPFPGSTMLASDPSSLVGPAVMTSILLPSLNRARETANRVKCASNQRQIGMAILLYSNENKGKYPPDLGTLIKTQDITPEVFVCPSSENDAVPAQIRQADKGTQAKWVNDHSAYVYVGAGMRNDAPADAIVLYEKSDNHDEDGMNFLYGDGHVDWQSMQTAQQLIKTAGQRK